MLLLTLALMTASRNEMVETAPEVGQHVERASQHNWFSLKVNPLSTFLLGVAIEAEVRVSNNVTLYASGEFYPYLLRAWGVQTGARVYTNAAFAGFFVDVHARASDLKLAHLLGGGVDIGSQHSLGGSRWSVLWAAGLNVGAGRWWQGSWDSRPEQWIKEDFVVVPNLRLMIGYTF